MVKLLEKEFKYYLDNMDIKANAFNIAYSGLSPVLKSEVH